MTKFDTQKRFSEGSEVQQSTWMALKDLKKIFNGIPALVSLITRMSWPVGFEMIKCLDLASATFCDEILTLLFSPLY